MTYFLSGSCCLEFWSILQGLAYRLQSEIIREVLCKVLDSQRLKVSVTIQDLSVNMSQG